MSTATETQLAIPPHFDPGMVGEIRSIPYGDLATAAESWALEHSIEPAATDRVKVALALIDLQNTFCVPTGELFVAGLGGNGAVDDNIRLCEFAYRNLSLITRIGVTMDTHTAMQIFHPVFWVNANGEHPLPFTEITESDVEGDVWMGNPALALSLFGGNLARQKAYCLHYVRTLAKMGRFNLTIWPYHGMLGGISHALVAAVEEMCLFHNHARHSQTWFETKGGSPYSEMYSAFAAEVKEFNDGTPIQQWSTAFLEMLLSNDVVIIAGQAKSHCLGWTIGDLLGKISEIDPTMSLTSKVYLLEDCTSAVVVRDESGAILVDHTQTADEFFERFTAAGMHVVQSTTPMSEWPGLEKLAA